MKELEKRWDALILKLENQFDDEMSLKGILYLIGVQELNFGVKRYDRDEKINVLHVAICKLLSNYGYYKFDSIDKDGWPHYIEIKALDISAYTAKLFIESLILEQRLQLAELAEQQADSALSAISRRVEAGKGGNAWQQGKVK